MIRLILLTAGAVALVMILLCFNILFRKNGQFPDSEIGHSREMRKRGIVCAKEEEIRMWRKKRTSAACDPQGCSSCGAGCLPSLKTENNQENPDNERV